MHPVHTLKFMGDHFLAPGIELQALGLATLYKKSKNKIILKTTTAIWFKFGITAQIS